MNQDMYDFAIVGTGAAGLQLAIQMNQDPFFQNKSILLLDKEDKKNNDRTWSFWEEGETEWDKIAWHTWNKGQFVNQHQSIRFDLNPYTYKSVRSADFYNYARQKFAGRENLKWVKDDIKEVNDTSIVGVSNHYLARHVFDSRVDESFIQNQGKYHSLIQHFRGWFIKTKKDVFDPDSFVMMDFRLKWQNSTSFIYVLPSSSTEALVEFTLFNDQLIEQEVYESYIKEYISEYLHASDYEICEIEQGAIPMTDFPFHKLHEKNITKIGTAGGWVRPSSGYSFKNAERYSSMIIENIKNRKHPSTGIANSRFRKYDSVFLSVLKTRNDLGEDIFTRLYTKPDIQSVFKFLDEDSTFIEDLKVMLSLNKAPFWKAFSQSFFR